MPSLSLRNALKRNPNRLTLRQRAAALKATAARVMRRHAPASSPEIAASLAGADPQLVALVAEWQDARRKLNDPDFPDGPEADAMGDRDAELQREIYLFPARTVADLVAKIPAFREEAEDALSGYAGQQPEETLPGAAWAGLLRDIAHLAGAAPVAETAPDPILTAIEASKTAHAARDAWAQRFNGGLPLSAADFAEEDRLGGVQSLAHDAVIATAPTTAAGRLALLEYLRWQMGLYGMADGEPPEAGSAFWRDAYKALKAALAFEGEGFGSALVDQPAVPSADLSKCSVPQLARLYEVFNARRQLAAVSTNAPFMWDGDNYNAAGNILESEYERLTDMAADIAAEIERRQPQDEDERDERLSVLVRQSIEGSGCISDPSLVAEIANAWKA